MQTDSRTERQIHILTHPFMGNYGGMLQAYALQRAIAAHVPATCFIDSYRKYDAFDLRCRMKNGIGELLLSCGKKASALAVRKWLRYKMVRPFYRIISSGTPVVEHESVNQNGPAELQYVVGSDQVWRGCYVSGYKSLPFFFLDFASEDVRRRSIAYAASFGSDEWEGTSAETERCGKLLRQFRAVSVREQSGVELCRRLFGVEAVQMPDPTLLLQAADYEKLIASEPTHKNEGDYIATYVLDSAPQKQASMQAVAEQMGMPLQPLSPVASSPNRWERQPLSVPQWLSYMSRARYVLTDSFHGCVFAIIFNKPFVCYGNASRGMARFDTLMRTFHLESRLVNDLEQVAEVLARPIDWEEVNAIRASERQRGLGFLQEQLD